MRMYPDFTAEQLKTIERNNGKTTLRQLADIIDVNYTNLSGMLKFHKVPFKPLVNGGRPVAKPSLRMDKLKNDEGEDLLTDDIMAEWFGLTKEE